VLGPSVVTAGMTINYLRAARATVVHANSRQAVCAAKIRLLDPAGTATLCAVAQGTIVATKPASPA
jgi:acyl-coenzyme A thioesterase PaaI-like protein